MLDITNHIKEITKENQEWNVINSIKEFREQRTVTFEEDAERENKKHKDKDSYKYKVINKIKEEDLE